MSVASFVRLVGAVAVIAVVLGPVVKSQEPELPDGEGKEVVQQMCGDQCHGLSTVVANQFTKDQWENTVKEMIARGAEGTDEDVQRAVTYLAKYFGKPPASKDKDGAKSIVSEHATQRSFEQRAALVCHQSATSVQSGRVARAVVH